MLFLMYSTCNNILNVCRCHNLIRSEWEQATHLREYYRQKEIQDLVKPKISIKHMGALWIIQLLGIFAASLGFIHEKTKKWSPKLKPTVGVRLTTIQ